MMIVIGGVRLEEACRGDEVIGGQLCHDDGDWWSEAGRRLQRG